MKKVFVTVELKCDVEDHVNENDICAVINPQEIKIVDFENRKLKVGKVNSYSVVEIEKNI